MLPVPAITSKSSPSIQKIGFQIADSVRTTDEGSCSREQAAQRDRWSGRRCILQPNSSNMKTVDNLTQPGILRLSNKNLRTVREK